MAKQAGIKENKVEVEVEQKGGSEAKENNVAVDYCRTMLLAWPS